MEGGIRSTLCIRASWLQNAVESRFCFPFDVVDDHLYNDLHLYMHIHTYVRLDRGPCLCVCLKQILCTTHICNPPQ